MDQNLKELLMAMVTEDNRLRAELVASGELFRGYNSRMADVHQRNAEQLDTIIRQHGWPGKSLVGEEGADAAWLILQHAIGNPAFQRKCLPLLKKSAEFGETAAVNVAYLEDRICVFEGRPQRYGTQFDWDESGQLSPLPLEDAEQVDVYRESVDLGRLSDRTEQVRRRAISENESPPGNLKKRRAEAKEWAKSVGWL